MSVVEAGTATEHEKVVSTILNPVAKMFLAKESLKVISEGLEAFGGIGYIEDSGLPAYLRNSQVLTIWEGTTNFLCTLFAKELQIRGEPAMEKIATWLRYIIDMSFMHPSEVIVEKKKIIFHPFKKMVLLYNALMPLLRTISVSKRKQS